MAEKANPNLLVVSARQEGVRAKQSLSYDVLKRQDDTTSNLIIDSFQNTQLFMGVAESTTKEIMQRDQEDADKLQKGIDLSIKQGVLQKLETPPVYQKIDVAGKSADVVAQEILTSVGDEAINSGCVIVIVGLSGTGKGTTVSKINAQLEKSLTWSNGNVFRSLTKLTAAYAKKEGKTVAQLVQEEGVLADLMKHLSFAEFEHGFDTKIEAPDLLPEVLYVNKVKNTLLKTPDVATNIPTVAEYSQALVVKYVDTAVNKLQDAGFIVLVEGREATVNYVNTPHRFELMMQDTTVIGMRRTAQRMAGDCLGEITPEADYETIYSKLKGILTDYAAQ